MSDLDFTERRSRIEPLLAAARDLADPTSQSGKRARERLVPSSGLSPEGVGFALERCLETNPSEAELERLIRGTPRAQVAHVLLSAQVFVAAHRAIAIALAASDCVIVRPSRREPEMVELLQGAAPDSFQIVSELAPRSGDRLWAYGSDETMARVAVTLPPGVALHAHGSGFGVCVIDGELGASELAAELPRLAEDVALFDQRGCLSPRVVLVSGTAEQALEVGQALAHALAEIEGRVPRGGMSHDEAAAITRYRDTASYAGQLLSAGAGFVSVGTTDGWLLPPVGRNVHVLPSSDPARSLAPLRPMITSCAFAGKPHAGAALRRSLPGARHSKLGDMQRPPLDGPVDLRDS